MVESKEAQLVLKRVKCVALTAFAGTAGYLRWR